MLNFLRSLDIVLLFFIFVFNFFFYGIYEEFLVYLIAGLDLAINEQSEKFWYGINDKVSMGEYREFGRVWMVGELGNFW